MLSDIQKKKSRLHMLPENLLDDLSCFKEFPKIPRYSRDCIITCKIDGTNACVVVPHDPTLPVLAQSRTRLLTVHNDNYGFCNWVTENADMLRRLGPGRHFGEWWGSGINRNYGQEVGVRHFSLFNVNRWDQIIWNSHQAWLQEIENRKAESQKREPKNIMKTFMPPPDCCRVVPVVINGPFCDDTVEGALSILREHGSLAAPGFMNPEGIVIYHEASGYLFKKTFVNDHQPKSL